jgi:hypothetical protein
MKMKMKTTKKRRKKYKSYDDDEKQSCFLIFLIKNQLKNDFYPLLLQFIQKLFVSLQKIVCSQKTKAYEKAVPYAANCSSCIPSGIFFL